MEADFAFDAVLFDLDGTLVATDRFWVAAARAGAHRAFQELGLAREIPSAGEWMSLVGYPLEQGFARLFPELAPDQLGRVIALCREEEEAALRAGGAGFLPGARELLVELRQRGVRLGIASNCGRSYLDHMHAALGLGELVHESRCLDSPRCATKADMLDDLLETFGTRSAVMVGDRRGDAEAARAVGIPSVHFSGAFADAADAELADATIGHLRDLVPLLCGRTRWIRAALERAGAFDPAPPRSIGIGGPSAAGKSLFARDAARLLAAEGVPARVVSLNAFLRAGADEPGTPEADHLGSAFDLAALVERVLVPHARGERVRLSGSPNGARVEVEPREVLLLEGLFLLDPRLRGRLDRLIYLALDDEGCLRRLAGRDARAGGPELLMRARRTHLPAQRLLEQRFPADPAADVVLGAGSPLGRS